MPPEFPLEVCAEVVQSLATVRVRDTAETFKSADRIWIDSVAKHSPVPVSRLPLMLALYHTKPTP